MKRRSWIALAALAALTACSGIPKRESEQETLTRYLDYAGPPVSSINYLGRFDSWRALGDDKLVVLDGNNGYLLTVQPPCLNLPFATRIGLTSTSGFSSVQSGFDYVRVGGGERCRIKEIRPIDYKRLRQAERTDAEASRAR